MSLQVAFPSLGEPRETYDAIVVGAGPAGLAAAIYLVRANLKTLVLEAEEPCGKLNKVRRIENYPGFPSTSGMELAKRMVKHADSVGVKIVHPARAIGFELDEEPKILRTRERDHLAKNVLLAMGVQRKKLQIPGAADLMGKGVSYCAICDGSFFKGKDVALIGNDEETIAEGLYLSGLTNKIYLVSGIETPRFQQQSLENLLLKRNVEHLEKQEATEIMGDSVVEKMKTLKADGETKEFAVQGVFVAGEKTPVGALLASAGLKTDPSGCVKVDNGMRTSLLGVYAAGDMTCGRKFQIAVSVGQGVTAALGMIRNHLEIEGKQKT
ncbi:MAG: FAD-dependent oxidoreductase [Candidatus Bathyarchaeota archaeon]